MIEISPIQPKYGTSAPAPTPTTEAKDYPTVFIDGKKAVEPGKTYTYRAITNARGPVSYKWTISLDGEVTVAKTEAVTVTPKGKGISLNLILTVTDKDGNSNERTWTIPVGPKK